jgi:hypothetical protein
LRKEKAAKATPLMASGEAGVISAKAPVNAALYAQVHFD